MRKGLLIGAACLAALQGCGGGGGGAEAPAALPQATDASGIWEGTATSDGETMEFAGVVTGDGEGRFIDGFGTHYLIHSVSGMDGEITIGFTAMARQGLTFMDGSTVTDGSFTGSVDERSSIELSYSLGTGESGTLSLAYNAIYERNSSLDKLTGPWDEQHGIQVFDPDGSFFEQDGFGCVYEGQATILDPDFNVYGMAMTISSCGDADGDYTGLAVLADFQATDDLLIVQMNSDVAVTSTTMLRL